MLTLEWLNLIVNILQFVFSGKQAVNKCFKLAIKQPVLDILRGSEISIKHKIHLYPVRFGKGEERPCLIGRIEDVRVIYESSALDENIELLNHQATAPRDCGKVVLFSFILL